MNNQSKLYVDVHVLQTVPPSCINQDDIGSPKTAVYGEVTRARVSSQAWKRAVGLMFWEMFSQEQVGLRTKRAVELVTAQLKDKPGQFFCLSWAEEQQRIGLRCFINLDPVIFQCFSC